MNNYVILIGRMVNDPQTKETENGKRQCVLKLAVPRDFKNKNGMYDTDFIECILLNGFAETIATYCKKGDLVGIKGKLACLSGEDLRVLANKITFLSSRKENEEE